MSFRQRTTILCTNSRTVSECTSFCERQSQTTYKAHDTEAYGMKPNVTSMNWTARLRQSQTTRTGSASQYGYQRQDRTASGVSNVLDPASRSRHLTTDYHLSPSQHQCPPQPASISPRDQTRMLYPLFNDKCSATYL